MRRGGENGVEQQVEMLAGIFGQETQPKIAVLLQQHIFPAIPPISRGVGHAICFRPPAGGNGETRFSDTGAFEKPDASGHSGWRVANRDGRVARSTHFENTP